MINTKALIAGFFIVSVACALASERGSVPIAIDKHPSGKLYILDYSGGIYARDDSGHLQLVARLPWGTRPIDILSARLNNQEFLFICVVSTGRGIEQMNVPNMAQTSGPSSLNYGRASQIIRMSADGHSLDPWNLPVACGGMDIDPGQHRIYFANSQSAEVFSLDLDQGERSIARVGFVRGAKSLGPLVVDPQERKLYTADVLSGTVFSYDLGSGEPKALSHEFGEPQALALKPDGTELYIADGLKQVVWKLSLTGSRSLVPFSSQSLVRPIGLATGANGHLWVADAGLRNVIDLAPTMPPEKASKSSAKRAKRRKGSEHSKQDH